MAKRRCDMVYIYLTENDPMKTTDEKIVELAKYHLSRLFLTLESENAFKIGRLERGKPYFSNMLDVHFSVSHSDDVFAFAIADVPVGIDVQKIKHRPDEEERCLKIARRYFHTEEIAAVEGRLESFWDYRGIVSTFYKIWCGKEAYVKLSGKGIDGDFSKFSVISTEKDVWWADDGEYAVAYCTEEYGCAETVRLFKENKDDTILHSPWRSYLQSGSADSSRTQTS